MKTVFNYSTLVGMIFLSLFSVACNSSVNPQNENLSGASQKFLNNGFLTADISNEIADGLKFMREEEKLARDVYSTFFDKYNLQIFNNIAQSESRHMAAIKTYLDLYGIEDPIVNDIRGVFSNDDLQNLYDQLVALGDESLLIALEVGGIIEETDIVDLMENIALVTEYIDITKMYTNLKRGSENHLRAFVKNLRANGITYEPHFLDQEYFDEIVNRRNGRGGSGN